MNNTELEKVADTLHRIRVMRRDAAAQFYNLWCTATRDPGFLRTGHYEVNEVSPIWVRESANFLWCWSAGNFWVQIKG
ncbi:TPA: hypothetical protein ACTNSM_004412 [Salmonella enterica subsp. enterica serovar Enteritidis]|nr:hypothetical protein [Salmonella enterica]